jgi:hypothetical protein
VSRGGDAPPIPGSDGVKKPPTISDKALAAVDSEWRTAREVFAILDEGAYRSTVAALVRACGCWQDRNDAMTRTET